MKPVPVKCGCGWPGRPLLVEADGIGRHVRYVCDFHAMNMDKLIRVERITEEEAVVWTVMET